MKLFESCNGRLRTKRINGGFQDLAMSPLSIDKRVAIFAASHVTLITVVAGPIHSLVLTALFKRSFN